MSSRILLTRLVSVLDLSRAYLPARALPLGAIPFSSFSTKPSSSSATTSPAAPPTVQPTEFTPNVREMTPAHITRVGELDAKMRASYDTLRTDGSVTFEEAYIKRLIFRSKQRGWLEVDLLMGAYATKFLAGKTKEELTVYERILNRETLDLYNIIMGKDPVPKDLAGPIIEEIKAFVQSSPLGRADPAAYARTKGTYSN